LGGWDIKDLTKTWGNWRKYEKKNLTWFGLSGKMELRIGKAWEELRKDLGGSRVGMD